MPINTVDPAQYIVGAGDVYYRAVGSVAAWTSIGATLGDVIARITQRIYNPSEDFPGITAPIREFDYIGSQNAEVEFTMNSFAGANLALAFPGATSTTTATTDAGGTPFSSTLAAAAAIGDTNVKVVAITNAAAGDYVRFNVAGALAEYRQIDVVGTAGAGGTGLSFRDPLIKAHASGVAAVETVGTGKTLVQPGTRRRMATTDYNDWAIVAQSPNDWYEMRILSGISTTESAELSFADETIAGVRVTIAARKVGTNLSAAAFQLYVPAAA